MSAYRGCPGTVERRFNSPEITYGLIIQKQHKTITLRAWLSKVGNIAILACFPTANHMRTRCQNHAKTTYTKCGIGVTLLPCFGVDVAGGFAPVLDDASQCAFGWGAHADGNSVTLIVPVRVGGGHADTGAEGVHGIVSVRVGGGHRQWIQRFSRPVRRENGLHHAGDSPRGHRISCEARTRMRFRRILAEISPPTRSTGILFMVEDVCFASRCCHRSARLPHLLHGIRHSAGCRTTIRHGTLVHYVAARRCPHTPAHTQLHT